MRFLIAGYSVRHIACSAARAGHEVVAADCFCDVDVKRCASSCVILDKENAESTVRNCSKLFSPDAVILGPGLEEMRLQGVRVLNNPPEKAAQVSDKLWQFLWLQSRGYPTIPTGASPEGLKHPIVAKPRKGAGGVGSVILHPGDPVPEGDFIFQEFVEGLPASVSVICNGSEARAIAVNEQLIGCPWAGAEGFRYSGNVTPLESSSPEMAEMAEEIVAELGLLGSNGVDFILGKKGPVVVEVNPRFQGSLDAVELSTGINIFEAHLRSFEGLMPEKPKALQVAGRAVIYAEEDLQVKEVMPWSWVTDIPRPGSEVLKGEPLASLVASGENRDDAVKLLKDRSMEVLSWAKGQKIS